VSDNDSLIVDMTTRIFQDLADPQTVNNAADEAWKAPLWSALEEAGLTRAWVAEEFGGAGISIPDGFKVLRVAGSFAVPVPLAETLIAGWLLAQAGLEVPSGPLTVAPTRSQDRPKLGSDGTLSGSARAVPFAAEADHIAVLAQSGDGAAVALVERAAAQVADGRNLASEPRNTVGFDAVRPVTQAAAPEGLDHDALLMMGAAVRSAEMAGALQALLDIGVAYSGERVAFERPIAKFQAVQHNLAQLAGETAAAVAATGSVADAIERADSFDAGVFLEVASAKIRVGEAAGEGAAIAHQVMGAIGFTKEHILHRFTQRLWSWRDDFGDESRWAARLGERIAAGGADQLWATVASG
jgi:acyl-CoA dehydrogenase